MAKSKISIVFLLLGGCSFSEMPSCDGPEVKRAIQVDSLNKQEMWDFIKKNGDGPLNPAINGYSDNENLKILNENLDKLDSQISSEFENCNKIPEDNGILKDKFQQCTQDIDENDEYFRSSCDWIKAWAQSFGGNPDIHRQYNCKNIVPLLEKEKQLVIFIESEKIKYFNSKFDEYVKNISYEIKDIIELKKSDNGSVNCRAQMKANIEGWGNISYKIFYDVYKTSEGKIVTERILSRKPN